MHLLSSGESEIDQCACCKAAWFDSGKIRELTEGRFPQGIEPAKEVDFFIGDKEKISARMSIAWGKAAFIFCLRCSRQLVALNFQNTGTPVFHCRDCGGILVSWDAVIELVGKFDFIRKNAAMYQALGESMAGEMQNRLNRKYGPDGREDVFLSIASAALGTGASEGEITLLRGASSSLGPKLLASMVPIVIPLKNEMRQSELYPVVTYGFLALIIAAYLFGLFGIAGVDGYQTRIALPSGVGFLNTPKYVILLALFFHGGFVPLLVNCLFLYVLGDNVEDRMGRIPFFFFYIVCGVVAGAAHIIFGKAGASGALGSAGAVAGVLGAYIVFFPQTPITVYKAGEVTSMPAYFLACAWLVAQFLLGWLPLYEFFEVFNPAPYSLAGNLGGLAAGVTAAALWRSVEPS